MEPICPYCNTKSELVKGDNIYPHRKDLYRFNFYLCRQCNAYVGTHKGTVKPLGRLADAKLRKAKSEAHRYFDPLWKEQGMKRKQAYQWLASEMNIDIDDCHIGMFNIDQCEQVVNLVINKE